MLVRCLGPLRIKCTYLLGESGSKNAFSHGKVYLMSGMTVQKMSGWVKRERETERVREIDLTYKEHRLQESCALLESSTSLAITVLMEHCLGEGDLTPVNRWDNSDLKIEPNPTAISEHHTGYLILTQHPESKYHCPLFYRCRQ